MTSLILIALAYFALGQILNLQTLRALDALGVPTPGPLRAFITVVTAAMLAAPLRLAILFGAEDDNRVSRFASAALDLTSGNRHIGAMMSKLLGSPAIVRQVRTMY